MSETSPNPPAQADSVLHRYRWGIGLVMFFIVAGISLVLARDVIWRHRAKVVVKLEFACPEGALGWRQYATNSFGWGVIYSEARLMCSEAIWRKARQRLDASAGSDGRNSALALSGDAALDLPTWEISPMGVCLLASGTEANQTAELLNHIAKVYQEERNELYPAPPGCEAINISIAEPAVSNGRTMSFAPCVRLLVGAALIGLAASLLARRTRAETAFTFTHSFLTWSCVSCGAALLILPLSDAVGIGGGLLLSFLMAAANQGIELAASRGSPVPPLLLKFTFISVFLGFIGWGLAAQLLESKWFLSRTRIRVDVLQPAARQALPLSYDAGFLATECALIESRLILGPLVHRLDMRRTLSQRYDFDLNQREGEAVVGNRVLAKDRQPGNVIDIYHWDDGDDHLPGRSPDIAEEYQAVWQNRSKADSSLKVEVTLLGSENGAERDTRVHVANLARLITEGMVCGLFALAGGLLVAFLVKRQIGLSVIPAGFVLYLAVLGVALLPSAFAPDTYSASSLVRFWPPLDRSPETADSGQDELIRTRQRRACQTANSDALFERVVNALKLHAEFAKQARAWKHGDDAGKRHWLRSHLTVLPVGDAYLLKFRATAERSGDATLIAKLAAEQYCEWHQLSPSVNGEEAVTVEILEKGQSPPWPEEYSNPSADGLLNILGYASLVAAGAGLSWIGLVIQRATQAHR